MDHAPAGDTLAEAARHPLTILGGMQSAHHALLSALDRVRVHEAPRLSRDDRRELEQRMRGLDAALTAAERGHLVLTVLGRRIGSPGVPEHPSDEARAAGAVLLDSGAHDPIELSDAQVGWALELVRSHLPQRVDASSTLPRAVLAYLYPAHREAPSEHTRSVAARLAQEWPEPTIPLLCLLDDLSDGAPMHTGDVGESPHLLALAQARLWSVDERRSLLALENVPAIAHASWSVWTERVDVDEVQLEVAHAELLAMNPARVDEAFETLQSGISRSRALHAGELAYHSDHLFTRREVDALARAAAVVLAADAPDAGPRVVSLIRDVSIAPTTAATAPSQAATHALGQWVARLPTPEAIAALTEVIPDVRHRGLVTRLSRQRRKAIKTLPLRAAVALRMPADDTSSAARKRTYLAALQGQFAIDTWWSPEEWHRAFSASAWTTSLASVLVFEHSSDGGAVWTAFRPGASQPDAPEIHGVDVEGGESRFSEGVIRLWHPARASAEERRIWREHVWAERIVQPFAQVFREHYATADRESDAEFAGFEVELRRLLGVALSDGWRVSRGALERAFGSTLVRFGLNTDVYPGMEGTGITERVRARVAGADVPFSEIPVVTASEALRAVDLLVSTSALETASADRRSHLRGDPRSTDRAAVRRIVVEHLHGTDPRVRVEGRRVLVGEYSVHLATARIMRNGEQVSLPDAPPTRRAFVPSDEKLLLSILDALDRLLGSDA